MVVVADSTFMRVKLTNILISCKWDFNIISSYYSVYEKRCPHDTLLTQNISIRWIPTQQHIAPPPQV